MNVGCRLNGMKTNGLQLLYCDLISEQLNQLAWHATPYGKLPFKFLKCCASNVMREYVYSCYK